MQPRVEPTVLLIPSSIAAAFVLTVFADSGSETLSLIRPLIAGVAIALVIQAVAVTATRRAELGTLIASMAVVALIDLTLGLVVVASLITARLYGIRRGRHIPTRVMAVPVLILLTMASFRAVTTPTFNVSDLVGGVTAIQRTDTGQHPDLYVILLDGYARSDTLAEWGYDNGWFEDALVDRAFDVDTSSAGIYTQTSLVLPSMLHMRPVQEIDELVDVPHDTAQQKRAIRQALRTAPSIKILREAGYDVVTAGFPRNYITLPDAQVIDHGRIVGFERQVLYRSTLRYLVPTDWVSEQHRQLVLDAFQDTISVAQTVDGPTMMLTHVISPHTPVVFGSDGEPVEPDCLPDCDPAQVHYERLGVTREQFGAGYVGQTHFINGKVLEMVDAIIEAQPEAAIVLFSDHGTRTDLDDHSEWFRTFFAARTPGRAGAFAHDGRALAIFPRLLNAYLGTDLDVPTTENRYVTPDGAWPLSIQPWP